MCGFMCFDSRSAHSWRGGAAQGAAPPDLAGYGSGWRASRQANGHRPTVLAKGETRRQLEYKTVLYGSKLTVRDRFHASSKRCWACGWKNKRLSLSDRVGTRRNCGALHHRNHKAAIHLVQPVPQAREWTPPESP